MLQARFLDRVAVDERSVAGAQVFHHHAVAGEHDLGVTAGHRRVEHGDVARHGPAHGEGPLRRQVDGLVAGGADEFESGHTTLLYRKYTVRQNEMRTR
jgi:hypothetical protein